MHRSIRVVQRSMSLLHRTIVVAHRRKVDRNRGFALIVVIVTVAVLGAVVSEFGYNARVEYEAASNARDALRAEYAARSGINLARLLIKVQTSVVDKLNQGIFRGQADFQITEFAPYLLSAFGGGDEERKDVGAMLGMDASTIKGLGLGKGASFDVSDFGSEDGKININCGCGLPIMFGGPGVVQGGPPVGGGVPPVGGVAPNGMMSPQQALGTLLYWLMIPQRYRRLFETQQSDGQYVTRDDVARAIIDWSDADEQMTPLMLPQIGGMAPTSAPQPGATEDYRYDSLRDPYKAHNFCFDTTEEVNLVRGVSDDYWGSFGSMFTVYGGCKVNLRAIGPDNWPILVAILRASAANPDAQVQVILDDVIMAAEAQQLTMLMTLFQSQTATLQGIASFGANGMQPQAQAQPMPGQQALPPIMLPFPGLPPIQIDQNKLRQYAKVGPRRVYRIESVGTVKRAGDRKIQVRIRAIFDTVKYKQNDPNPMPGDTQGTWVYWRVE